MAGCQREPGDEKVCAEDVPPAGMVARALARSALSPGWPTHSGSENAVWLSHGMREVAGTVSPKQEEWREQLSATTNQLIATRLQAMELVTQFMVELQRVIVDQQQAVLRQRWFAEQTVRS